MADVQVHTTFISAGCNRVVNAAAWGPCSLVAFACHNAVVLFSPETAKIVQILPGHKSLVHCLEWLPKHVLQDYAISAEAEYYLLSGSADGVIIMWSYICSENKWQMVMQLPDSHKNAVTCISAFVFSTLEAMIVSSSSDCAVHIWRASLRSNSRGDCRIDLMERISTGPRAALAVSLAELPTLNTAFVLALGGLDNHIHLYCGTHQKQFVPTCILKAHQDWVRALEFSPPVFEDGKQELFLASCGQDRCIRIWRVIPRRSDSELGRKGASIKMYIEGPVFRFESILWQASMESLLIGHDDWVYSVRWQPPFEWDAGKNGLKLQDMSILSASMDRTMMIWHPDQQSGLWINDVTVGELGHTALGFYGGVWSPNGDAILAHAFGGSFHMWRNFGARWRPQLVPSGHTDSVVDIAWANSGQFLLSASLDQTTRLFVPWDWSKSNGAKHTVSWHEIARPQVHGHDLSCLTVLKGKGNHRYVSGAEEKVARVFEAPASFLQTLEFLRGTEGPCDEMIRPEDVKVLGANMSALGLSQKPIYTTGNYSSKDMTVGVGMEAFPDAVPSVLVEPPVEEHLGWNTLWPESYKLYGHGNELFAMSGDHSGELLATSCKAQSESVAEIWLWQIGSWKAVCQLHSHSLTVTQMEFSHNDRFLLSVSRDRHFSVFQILRSSSNNQYSYKVVSRHDAHRRIIWTCSWSPCDAYFATGSRDKFVRLWMLESDSNDNFHVTQAGSLPMFKSSVTAVAWAPMKLSEEYLLAVGMEEGLVELWIAKPTHKTELPSCFECFQSSCVRRFDVFSCHVASINRFAWREKADVRKGDKAFVCKMQLASCGADHILRLFHVVWTCKL